MDSKAFDYIRRIDALKAYDNDEYKFQENLQNLFTIDIVYCGECKYNETGYCPMAWWDSSLQKLLNHCTADDFCSKGKRKDE